MIAELLFSGAPFSLSKKLKSFISRTFDDISVMMMRCERLCGETRDYLMRLLVGVLISF